MYVCMYVCTSSTAKGALLLGQHLEEDPIQSPEASRVAHQHAIRIVAEAQVQGHGPREVHGVEAKRLDFLVLGLHGSGDGVRIGQASLDSWGPRTI